MSVARYSREVVLDDLNNVHTFAVLSIAPGRRVLDIGAADGSVARALSARGCAVTAIERDAAGVAALGGCCARVIHADVESLSASSLASEYDDVLLLDVLEHLVDPGRALRLATGWLAPHGRIHLSLPNVAHGSVRLALFQGRWQTQDTGLLDRTHLQYFDRSAVDLLLAEAGLEVVEDIPVTRDPTRTEIDVDLSLVSPELMREVCADPLSHVYQFFITARLRTSASPGTSLSLATACAGRVRATEASYRELEQHVRHVEADAAAGRRALEDLASASPQESEVVENLRQSLEDARVEQATLEQQLGERMTELQQMADVVGVLQRDAEVHRAYAAELAEQVPRIAALGGEDRLLADLAAFREVVADPVAARHLASEAAELERLRGTAAFRLLGRLDAWLRRMPAVRRGARAMVRLLVRSG